MRVLTLGVFGIFLLASTSLTLAQQPQPGAPAPPVEQPAAAPAPPVGQPAAPAANYNVGLAKSAVGSNWSAGSKRTFDLTVTNKGDALPAGTVLSVTDSLPGGFSFVSGTAVGWTCVAGVTCTYTVPSGGGVASGAALPTIPLAVRAAQAGSFQNCASVALTNVTETDLSDNKSCLTVAVASVGHPRVRRYRHFERQQELPHGRRPP
jgi:uncharacterized repeat protein (TIGR01451 family)